ncbi:hypothetical protein DFQ01_13465 [Paenibacillus cellulosilyticus]|uniref:Pectate lyase-like protein n=1 Tax=Paenibacillus cellulosilyticus TaxID=375489 RepID=A0A2V2YLW8_9BACL|nr:hypothetical protein [Paenibacillus cellulosilyticus]PWV93825.1 hypothetical protein DFQ01_13465 [Paenibacillus cellulosilyticus]QKS47440.1 hypothetical protein HUB94_23930 [Paenibacillus cellulosilyticus]
MGRKKTKNMNLHDQNDREDPLRHEEKNVHLSAWDAEFSAQGNNVQLEGAAGDGITDDTDVFEQTIANMANWGTLNLPDPLVEYRISRSIIIDKIIRIKGQGISTSINYVGEGDFAFNIKRTSQSAINSENQLFGVVLEKFYLKGNRRQQAASGIYMEHVDQFIIQEVHIEGFKGHGIKMSKCREGDLIHLFTRYNGYQDAVTDLEDIVIDSPSTLQGDRSNEINIIGSYSIFPLGSNIRLDGADRIRASHLMVHGLVAEGSIGTPGYALKKIITNLFGTSEYPDPEIHKNTSLLKLNNGSEFSINNSTFTSSGKKMFSVDSSKLKMGGNCKAGGFYDWTNGTSNYIIYATNGSKVRFANNEIGDCSEPFYRDSTSKVRFYDNDVVTQSRPQSMAGNESIEFYNDLQLGESQFTAKTVRANDIKNRSVSEPLKIDVTASTLDTPLQIKALLNDRITAIMIALNILSDGTSELLIPHSLKALSTKSIYYRSRSANEQMIIDLFSSALSEPYVIRTKDEAGTSYRSSVYIGGNGTQSRQFFIGKQDTDMTLNIGKSSPPRVPIEGDIYWDTVTKQLKVYNGSTWKTVNLS